MESKINQQISRGKTALFSNLFLRDIRLANTGKTTRKTAQQTNLCGLKIHRANGIFD